MFSRRKLLAAGTVAGAASLLAPSSMGAKSLAGTQSATSPDVGSYITLMPPSDEQFNATLDLLFPGLAKDPVFQKIKAQSVLATNVSGRKLRAFSTHWKLTTATGGYETVLRHRFHPSARKGRTASPGVSGNKTRFTGKIAILKAGATRLVTPYFNWSTNYYRKNPTPNWTSLLTANESRKFFLNELSSATQVEVSIDCVVVNRKTAVGSDKAKLADLYRISRNAEHDEAVSAGRLLASGASLSQVASLLESHLSFKLPARTDAAKHRYFSVRQRQAHVLLARLKHGTPAQFASTVHYLQARAKTFTKSASAPVAS